VTESSDCTEDCGGGTICFVQSSEGIEQRSVQVGRNNEKWIQILEGLEEGEVVLLSPPIDFQPEAAPEASRGGRPGGGRPEGGRPSAGGSSGGGARPASAAAGGRPSGGGGRPSGGGRPTGSR